MTRFFNVNNPSQVVTITLDHGNFYQLSDGNMIKKETFDSKYQPILEGFEHEHVHTHEKSTQIINSDFINPDDFFNSTSVINNAEIEKLKNVNTNSIPDINDFNRTTIVNKDLVAQKQPSINEGIITPIRPEDVVIPNNTITDVSQYKVYDNDDDAYNDFVKKTQSTPPVQKPKPIQQVDPMIEINSLYDDEMLVFGQEEALKRKNKRINKIMNVQEQQAEKTEETIVKQEIKQEIIQQVDPFQMMFSTFKRNHEVVFNVEFKDKIGNPEFIKMMMENMDGDIIGFYKKSIMDNIMKNLSIIESVVEKELIKILGDENIIEDGVIEEKVEDVIPISPEIRIISETKEPKKTRKPYTKKQQNK